MPTSIVFLPATDMKDTTYGSVPLEIEGQTDPDIYTVEYPHLVWYNDEVQREAITQIREWGISSLILVGFSKSGLGAWNITRKIPELIKATIIFDSPVARQELPNWGTDPFYDGDPSWQRDLPLNSVSEFCESVSDQHRLILISAEGFHSEMLVLSEQLNSFRHDHVFLDRREFSHHWNSGWLEDGLQEV